MIRGSDGYVAMIARMGWVGRMDVDLQFVGVEN
jgi:hypothetical protein